MIAFTFRVWHASVQLQVLSLIVLGLCWDSWSFCVFGNLSPEMMEFLLTCLLYDSKDTVIYSDHRVSTKIQKETIIRCKRNAWITIVKHRRISKVNEMQWKHNLLQSATLGFKSHMGHYYLYNGNFQFCSLWNGGSIISTSHISHILKIHWPRFFEC